MRHKDENKSGIDSTFPKHPEKQKKTAFLQKKQEAKESGEKSPNVSCTGKEVGVVEGHILEKNRTVHLMSALCSFYEFQSVGGKDVKNPANFPQCQILMTFLKNLYESSKVWGMLAAARDAVPNWQLMDTESPHVKALATQCMGRTSVLVHPSLY